MSPPPSFRPKSEVLNVRSSYRMLTDRVRFWWYGPGRGRSHSAGLALAAVLAVAALPLSVFTMRSPVTWGSTGNVVQGFEIRAYDVFGHTQRLNEQGVVIGGDDFGPGLNWGPVVLVAVAVLLGTAALSMPKLHHLLGGRVTSLVAANGGPLAVGALGSVAASIFLTLQAFTRPYEDGGAMDATISQPQFAIGPAPWLLGVSAAVGAVACLVKPATSLRTRPRSVPQHSAQVAPESTVSPCHEGNQLMKPVTTDEDTSTDAPLLSFARDVDLSQFRRPTRPD